MASEVKTKITPSSLTPTGRALCLLPACPEWGSGAWSAAQFACTVQMHILDTSLLKESQLYILLAAKKRKNQFYQYSSALCSVSLRKVSICMSTIRRDVRHNSIQYRTHLPHSKRPPLTYQVLYFSLFTDFYEICYNWL